MRTSSLRGQARRLVSNFVRMGWIYKLTSPSGKAYIGKTQQKRVDIRLKQHCHKSSKCRAISHAIQKYGIDSFVVEKWEYPDEYLTEYEKLFIEDHGTLRPGGYNLNAAGIIDNQHYSTKVRATMGEITSKLWLDADYRERTCNALKKRWEDPEQRELASVAAKKRFENPEEKVKTSLATKKVWADPEYREKMKESRVDVWNEATRAKASASASLKFENNPAHKEKIRQEQKALWADPEHKARMKVAMTGRKMSEEGRARVRESRKRQWEEMTEEQKRDRVAKQQAGRQKAKAAKLAAAV